MLACVHGGTKASQAAELRDVVKVFATHTEQIKP
jgi:hypothetical protein